MDPYHRFAWALRRLLPVTLALLCWRIPAALAAQATPPADAPAAGRLFLNEIMAANASTITDPDFGNFGDYIEIYNSSDSAIDLGGFTITDNITNPVKWLLAPDTSVPAGGYLLLWADGIGSGQHSNFRLARDGEEVALYDAAGRLVDMVRFGDQVEDVSYGRVSDGAAQWAFFERPTPGHANTGPVLPTVAQAPAPAFSAAGGRYDAPLTVALSSPSPNAEIRFTLDGSRPTHKSALYEVPLQLSETAVIRARTFADGLLASPVSTRTYLIGEQTQLPVISLVTDPDNLWDAQSGLYVDEEIEKRKDWERPATIALFEPDGRAGFQAEVSIRLFGRSAIYLPQKSLAIFVEDGGDGDPWLDYPLFPDRDGERYAAFLLRSGSDDWAGTMLSDAFGQRASAGFMDLGTQAFRPALVYINGDYFGIHNIREKQNEDYLVSQFGADLEALDLLFVGHSHGDGAVEIEPLHGDAGDFETLLDFATSYDLALPEPYAVVQSRLDIDHFIDYVILESYVGNTSWHRNRKVWRARAPHQRWDFLVYDLDRGFGNKHTNTLLDMLNFDPLLDALLANAGFKQQFIQRFAHHLNVTFDPQRMAALFNDLQADTALEIERHRAFWPVAAWWSENYEREAQITGRRPRPELPTYAEGIAHIQEFVQDRPPALRQHIVEAFGLSGTQLLTLDVNEPQGGRIEVEGLPLPDTPFTGVYFRDMPLQLTAVAEPGYHFVAWEGTTSGGDESLALSLTSNETITAIFEPSPMPARWPVSLEPHSWATGTVLLALAGLVVAARRRHRP